MSAARELLAIARLDAADVLRSRGLATCVGLYAALGGAFVLVGMRESSVLAFTGVSRVLFSLSHALLFLLPLLGLVFTGQVINRARADGTLELLLSQPVGPTRYLVAVTGTRSLALTLPLLLVLLVMGVLGAGVAGQPVPWSLILRSALLCAVLLWAFCALGIAISVRVQSPARAMTYLILAWLLAVALLDAGLIGALLRWRLPPQGVFALAVLNPVESVRIALLSAVEPELASLGPVGFWVANRLGAPATLLVGLLWPLCFGAIAFSLALRRFGRGDRV